ncbi:condensation domain-containing protein [Streptomyces sp. NPDC056948]|uniref:condensation domain-containing protein n=1 Tax=Streptomyces sp. NPDC056948 TaxID=3345975 RepID=UPI00363DE0B6
MTRAHDLMSYATGRTLAPASHEQEWMLFLARMRRTGTFNMPRLYEIGPGTSAAQVSDAVARVVARSPLLRIRIGRQNGRFVQQVEQADATAQARPELLNGPDPLALLGEFVRRPLDPQSARVFASALAPLPGGGHAFATVVHHTVADAVTLDELERRIGLELDGRGDEYGERVSYLDYAAWQHDTYGARLDALVDESVIALKDARPNELPGVGLRSRAPGSGLAASFGLDSVADDALRALLTEERASPFMAGLAALSVALQDLSGQSAALIAIEVSTRRLRPLMDTLGPFISTVPVVLDAEDSFRQALRAARETTLRALELAHVPYHRLLARPELRALRRRSEAAVDVVYQTFHEQEAPDGGRLRRIPYGMDGAGFTADLHISMHESPGHRRLGIGHSPRVPSETVADLARGFEQALSHGVTDPDAPLNRRSTNERGSGHHDSGE